jgi:TonB-dependent starch-binding outer membrane protein SusC
MKTIYKKLLFLLLLLPFSLLAQSVEGVVLDSKSNQPIPGVNVVIKGTSSGVSTDLDGKFKIAKIKNGDVLEFSFIGYQTETVQFSGQKTLKVSMEESANQLQEVVVQIGYGNVKKKDATGSTTVISSKDFNRGSNVNADNLLQGRVAGVTINSGGGAPGTGSTIRIRGGSSLTASNDPLIVLDGLPIENATVKGATSFLASLNPSSIESVTVLKDASATAIYGTRGSNGVIIITTKKGSKKLAVDYNFQYGTGKTFNKVDVFSADEFRSVIQENKPAELSSLGNANTDWQDEIYRRTDFVDNSLNLTGNLFNIIPSRLTIGNTYQEGLRLTNKFNRTTVGVALNPSFFSNHLKIRVNANYSNEKNRFADGVEGAALSFDPTQPVYDANSIYGGFFEYYNTSNGELTTQTPRNPVAQLLQTYDTGKSNRFFGNIELDYKLHFFPKLRAVVNVGFDQANGERIRLVPTNAASGPSNNNIPFGTDEFGDEMRKNKLLDTYLVYDNTFGKLKFDLTAGYSYQKWDAEIFESRNILGPTPLGSLVTVPFDTVLLSYFGRTNFSFADKYLLTFSVRRDLSSKFDPETREGFFPGAAFAWKIKQDFFKNSKTISDLKLRIGYGATGQQDISNKNDYLQFYSLGQTNSQYTFGNTATPVAVSNRLSSNLKWETTITYNAGLDFGLFNNRVTGSIDAFLKESKDLLFDTATPDGTNFSNSSFQNVGSFETKGIELTLGFDAVKTTNTNWNISFNATTFQRKITNIGNSKFLRVGENVAGTGTQAQVLFEGFAPFSYYLYKQLYDTAGNPIEGAYADLNGDGIINASDKYIYKNPDPKLVLGFASTFNYKNFDMYFNLRASIGNRVFNQVAASRAQYNNIDGGNAVNNVPSSVSETNFTTTSNVVLSDYYVENGSFLRMDNLTLGYTFPKWLEGKASVRLYTGCQNAFLITKYSGLDPEVGNNGFDNTIYPRQRQYLFGANIKF